MPIDTARQKIPFGITGSLRIEYGDFHFKLRVTPEYFVADFPSFAMILRAKRMGNDFAELIKDIPAPPSLPRAPGSGQAGRPSFQKRFLEGNFVFAAVNRRPVGKLRLKDGSIKFRPTPFSFFLRPK